MEYHRGPNNVNKWEILSFQVRFKSTRKVFNVLEETPLDLFSLLGLFVTCELWVEKMVEKVSRT